MLQVIYHRGIQRDLRAALAFYDHEGGSKLGDRFFAEAEELVAAVLRNPRHFHPVDEDLRRAGLSSFPYHFIYRLDERSLHFLVLRHDKRHPSFGLKRK